VKRLPPPTPGPWWFALGMVYGADGEIVADNVGVRDVHQVAAAPELLAAVADLVDAFGLDDRSGLTPAQRIALNVGERALALARCPHEDDARCTFRRGGK
jgi:hypothetical protein